MNGSRKTGDIGMELKAYSALCEPGLRLQIHTLFVGNRLEKLEWNVVDGEPCYTFCTWAQELPVTLLQKFFDALIINMIRLNNYTTTLFMNGLDFLLYDF